MPRSARARRKGQTRLLRLPHDSYSVSFARVHVVKRLKNTSYAMWDMAHTCVMHGMPIHAQEREAEEFETETRTNSGYGSWARR